MKGTPLLLSLFLLVSLLFVGTCFGATFAPTVSCDWTMSTNSDFQTYITNTITTTWTGTKNLCFNEGIYNFPQRSSRITLVSALNWYGAQFLADPTCGGNPASNCSRLVTAKALSSTHESVLVYNPPTTVNTFPVFASAKPFNMYGFSLNFSNVGYPTISVTGSSFVQNNYFFLSKNTASGTAIPFAFGGASGSFTVTSNYYAGPNGAALKVGAPGLFSNNYVTISGFSTSVGITVTGNTFSYNSAVGVTLNGGVSYIHNNTFLYSGIGINSGSANIDGNLFVSAGWLYTFIDIESPTDPTNITNNIFAGPSEAGAISNYDPYILKNNDFIEATGVTFYSDTWNTSSALVSGNYVGPEGAFQMPNLTPAGNTRITTFTAQMQSLTDFPYTLTPNHANLPSPTETFIQNLEWNVVPAVSRSYFLVGDFINVTWTYQIPSWYQQFNLPTTNSLNFLGTTSLQFQLWAGANLLVKTLAQSATSPLASMYFGANSYNFTLQSTHLKPQGAQSGYFFVVAPFSTMYSTYPAKSIFQTEPVILTLNTLPENNNIYSIDQTNVTANIFTDASIYNITLAFKNVNTSEYIDFDYLINGTGSSQSYSLPVNNITSDVSWQISVSFFIPSGEMVEVTDDHIFGGSEVIENQTPPPSSNNITSNSTRIKYPFQCFNESLTVDKGLKQTNPIQVFTLQDFGCNTTDWEIIGVNTTVLYSYGNNSILLNISSALSGKRPVHYQTRLTNELKVIRQVISHITIVNHRPVINSATFTWSYPRLQQTFPNWNLLSDCVDQDGDNLSVVQILRTDARTTADVVQLNELSLYFVLEKVVLSVLSNGTISLTSPSNSNPVTAGSPLPLFWNKNLQFQFQITDGDVTKQYAWGVAEINEQI